MNFKDCFRHLVLTKMISFEKIFNAVAQKVAMQLNNLGAKFLSSLSTHWNRVWWIPSYNNLIPAISMPASSPFSLENGRPKFIRAAATLQG